MTAIELLKRIGIPSKELVHVPANATIYRITINKLRRTTMVLTYAYHNERNDRITDTFYYDQFRHRQLDDLSCIVNTFVNREGAHLISQTRGYSVLVEV